MTIKSPKAFISYSWSTPGHIDRIRSYAERLVNDGVEVVLDQWDLSEGQDKYAFMEKMVTDESVSHVLIFSDQEYSQKADNRKAGVGTESQIISKEIYDKVDQKKFIPIVCERQEDGEPYLPVFLKSRIWIDFSSPESENENWERILRALYGKSIHEKPTIGKPPSYITDDADRPSLPTIGKFNSLHDALVNQKPTIAMCRNDFIDAAISFADELRVRERPEVEHIDEKILDDIHKLLPLRDQLVDWLLLETAIEDASTLEDVLQSFLEKLIALKYRPPEITSFNDTWFDAHSIFVYEMFLYLIGVLIKNEKITNLRTILTSRYLLPESVARQGEDFVSCEEFYTSADALEYRNKRLKLNRLSLLADLMKERATRKGIPFRDVMQAELVVLLVSLLTNDMHWYPHTLVFSGRRGGRFPLFIRAAQHKHFAKLKTITGIASGNELREKFKEGCEGHQVKRWTDMRFMAGVSFWNSSYG